jgi:hypothetical protein
MSARADVKDADIRIWGRGRGEHEGEDCGERGVLSGAGRRQLGEKEKVGEKREDKGEG